MTTENTKNIEPVLSGETSGSNDDVSVAPAVSSTDTTVPDSDETTIETTAETPPEKIEESATENTEDIEPVVEKTKAKKTSRSETISAENLRILEALLFASDEPLSALKLKTVLPEQPDSRIVRKMVDEINVQLQKERHPFEIVEVAGGYQFKTVPYYHTWIRQLFKEKTQRRLSAQTLETLAIIAYNPGSTKAEIETIRGVECDGAMKTLLERRLITITGRSEKAGRPLLYSTTAEFLAHFGLNALVDLPKIEEFEAMARQKLGDLDDAQLQMVLNTKEPVEPAVDENGNLLCAEPSGVDPEPAVPVSPA